MNSDLRDVINIDSLCDQICLLAAEIKLAKVSSPRQILIYADRIELLTIRFDIARAKIRSWALAKNNTDPNPIEISMVLGAQDKLGVHLNMFFGILEDLKIIKKSLLN